MTLAGIVYVVTCGQCGQTWHQVTAIEGKPMECIFCGRPGRLVVGASPGEESGGAPRIEAWLTN